MKKAVSELTLPELNLLMAEYMHEAVGQNYLENYKLILDLQNQYQIEYIRFTTTKMGARIMTNQRYSIGDSFEEATIRVCVFHRFGQFVEVPRAIEPTPDVPPTHMHLVSKGAPTESDFGVESLPDQEKANG